MGFRNCVPRKLGWLPFALGLTLGFGVAIIFVIAVLRRDVHPFLPYISEAGGNQPESGIFALILFLGALLSLGTMFVRYKIMEVKTGHQPPSLGKLNKAAFLVGIVALIGMVMVAAYPLFQLAVPHYVGAFLFFQCSALYVLLQAILSYKTCPGCHRLSHVVVRFIIFAVAISCFIIFLVTNKKMFGKISKDETTVARAKTAGAVAEWLMAFSLVIFFFSFIGEFGQATMDAKVYIIVENFEELEAERQPLLSVSS